jgi:hypothetical protein
MPREHTTANLNCPHARLGGCNVLLGSYCIQLSDLKHCNLVRRKRGEHGLKVRKPTGNSFARARFGGLIEIIVVPLEIFYVWSIRCHMSCKQREHVVRENEAGAPASLANEGRFVVVFGLHEIQTVFFKIGERSY